MRVIAGKARRLPLKTLEGLDTRPTQDRIKETLFNMIQDDISNSIFVDLFSGSGSIGIEALSRGAKQVVLVEQSPKACEIIKDNLVFTKLEDNASIVKQDVFHFLKSFAMEYVNIIFMDPPYHKEYEKETLKLIAESKNISTDCLIIVEAALNTDFEYIVDYGYTLVKEKRYKTNKHLFLKKER